MIKTINPSAVQGIIQAPSSKSFMQRAIAAALLANGTTELLSPSFCDDSLAAIDITRDLGAEIQIFGEKVVIKGGLNLKSNTIFCGESGLASRMFSPFAAFFNQEVIIDGKEALRKRPMHMVAEALEQLGCTCATTNGYMPIRVKGSLKAGKFNIDGSISSQILTGLLFILPILDGESIICVKNLKSKPYIDMTIKLLKDFGIHIENHDYSEFSIKGNQSYIPQTYQIEGDWSGAAFWLVAGAIAGNIQVQNINLMSTQADKQIINVLLDAGASVSIMENAIEVRKSMLKPFDFDATDCPDLFPPLVALASRCYGTSKILGISRLQHKESNRAIALQQEFGKLGINIQFHGDLMMVEGGDIQMAEIESHHDHRIAMAASIAALCGKGNSSILNAECVTKSYPEFFKHLELVSQNMNE